MRAVVKLVVVSTMLTALLDATMSVVGVVIAVGLWLRLKIVEKAIVVV
jgi:hypothetical protein